MELIENRSVFLNIPNCFRRLAETCTFLVQILEASDGRSVACRFSFLSVCFSRSVTVYQASVARMAEVSITAYILLCASSLW